MDAVGNLQGRIDLHELDWIGKIIGGYRWMDWEKVIDIWKHITIPQKWTGQNELHRQMWQLGWLE